MGNLPLPLLLLLLPLLFFSTFQGGVVGGVIIFLCSICQLLLMIGGDRISPGLGGIELHELRLEAAESTLGMHLVVGVVGIMPKEAVAVHSLLLESLFLLRMSCLGEADSSRALEAAQ